MFKPFPVTVLPGGQKVRTDLRPYSDEVEPEPKVGRIMKRLMEEDVSVLEPVTKTFKAKPKKSEGDSE